MTKKPVKVKSYVTGGKSKNTNKKLIKITTVRQFDDMGDLSYLGTFSDEPSKFAVESGGARNTYKYFNADNVENMKQAQENYKRMMEFERGSVVQFGIIAKAEIGITMDGGNSWLTQEVTSGGLWGLDSDSDEKYLKEVEDEQLDELKTVLLSYGFKKDEIKKVPVIRNEEIEY